MITETALEEWGKFAPWALKNQDRLLPVGVSYNPDDAYKWFLEEIIPRMNK
jgi:hypothetical protein